MFIPSGRLALILRLPGQDGNPADLPAGTPRKGMMTMIEKMMELYQQYYTQVMTWYQASDALTQYVVLCASGIVLFLLSITMVLSRITR